MSVLDTLIALFPEVAKPKQQLSFKEKLKWTLLILCIFFVMGMVPLFGLGQNALQHFEFLSIILGASFGSIISLGIGPIVTASIVLQLLNGAGLIKMDLSKPENRKRFQGLQKITAFFFVIFEAFVYVFMGGLAPDPLLVGAPFFQMQLMLVFQLILGGILIMFMDDVVGKWGFGSGISLFIAAGVSQQIFIRALNPLPSPTNPGVAAGAIPALFQSLASGYAIEAGLYLTSILATVLVFFIAVYTQALRVEIPLSFGMVRGHGVRWPLNFFYTSNIPVILVAALLANVQLFGRLIQSWLGHGTFLGTFSDGTATAGLAAWINSPSIVQDIIRGSITGTTVLQAVVYMGVMVAGSIVFAIFWMQSANMDAKSQAKQILNSGLQIPGFRKDTRILESILGRYIWPLTIMGGASVGFLAALADLTGALSRGTGILLTVMIVYKLYEDVAKQHMMDMHPLMRKMMK